MLLQTNSYIVPKDRRAEHARLLRRFRQVLMRLGCELFEVYEQMGPNWTAGDGSGRFVQIMRFRDRKHQREVHAAEQSDPAAQQLIAEFCDLVNLPYQQQQGLLAIGYYQGVIDVPAAVINKVAETPAAATPLPGRAQKPATKPRSAFGFGVPNPAAAGIPTGLAFGAAAMEQDDADVADEAEPTAEATAVEEPEAAAETNEEVEQIEANVDPGPSPVEPELAAEENQAAESEFAGDFMTEELAEPLTAEAPDALAEESAEETAEEELSGLDFADESAVPTFAEAPTEPEPVAEATADPEDDVEAVLDGLDFSDLEPTAEAPADNLDSLEFDFPEEPSAEVAPLEQEAVEGELELSPELDAALAESAEAEEAAIEASADESDISGIELTSDTVVETELAEQPSAEIAPEPLVAESATADDWMSELDLQPAVASEPETPSEFQIPEIGDLSVESEPEAVASETEAWTSSAEVTNQPVQEQAFAEASNDISGDGLNLAEPGVEETPAEFGAGALSVEPEAVETEFGEPVSIEAEAPDLAETSDRIFGLESEAVEETAGEFAATEPVSASDELIGEAAAPELPTASRSDVLHDAFALAAPAAAGINGHHAAAPEVVDEPAEEPEAAAEVELPMTLLTDEGEIEILYEEFPENFDDESVGDEEIEAALNEALRD